MKLIKNITTSNCILNIYVKDITGCTQYIFDAEDLKTAYVYKGTYTYEYLAEHFKIISIYPNLFDQLCDKIIPKIYIDLDKKYCGVEWEVDILFNKELILLQIPEHTFEGQNNELVSLQRSNKLLIQKNKKMEEDIDRLNMFVSMVLDTQLANIYRDHKLIEILFTANTSLKENPVLNYMVLHYVMNRGVCEKKLAFLRELIRCGYSVTLQNQLNCCASSYNMSGMFSEIGILKIDRSIYSIFLDRYLVTTTEEEYQLFKKITDIILPTADLNQIYSDKETIMTRLIRMVSEMPTNDINNGQRIIEYLRSIGMR